MVFQEPGYSKNHMGSILSPLQNRISWDMQLTARALHLLNLLAVTNKTDLIRIGSKFDGGYFLPQTYIKSIGIISGGIGDNNDFEFQLASLGKKILQYDPSIEVPPKTHSNLAFKKLALGELGISLAESTNQYRSTFGETIADGILKIDIEGFEWELFAEYSDSNFQDQLCNAFAIIVAELHFLSSIHEDAFWYKVKLGLETLLRFYEVVAINGNNCREIVQVGGVPIVDIVEVTFLRKSFTSPQRASGSPMQSSRNLEDRSPVFISWPTLSGTEMD